MLPLIGLAIQAAPFIAKLFGGDKAEEVTKAVTETAASIFGTSDPKAIETKIAADPALYVQWQTKLAELASAHDQREHEERLEEFKDVVNARDNYAKAAKNITDKLAVVTVALFFILNTLALYGMYQLLVVGVKITNVELALSIATMFGTLLGWVNSKCDLVLNFFFGSSRGSDGKNDVIANALNKAIKSVSKK